MRLYLSSFRNGNKPNELLTDARHGRRTALILNAMDFLDEKARTADLSREVERLESIGLEPVEIDLRQYFGKTEELRAALSGFDLIWVRGGNVFILRRALAMSSFDIILKDLLVNDRVVYGGYSAGIDILQPHLHGIELVDDPNIVPEGYSKEVIWDCLGLLPYCVAPHFQSDHPESADIDKTVEYYIQNHIPFVALKDGEAIVINGDEEKVVA